MLSEVWRVMPALRVPHMELRPGEGGDGEGLVTASSSADEEVDFL